jgi:hypothetical protein
MRTTILNRKSSIENPQSKILSKRYLQFLADKSIIPPLEESYFVLDALERDPTLVEGCHGPFAMAHIFAATARLYKGEEKVC